MRRPGPDDWLDDVLHEQGPIAWRLIVRILGDDGHDAADCFQQSLVELATRRAGQEGIREAGALLKKIAAARAIDAVRRRVRERGRSRDIDGAPLASRRHVEPDARAEAGELLDDLRVALAELPAPQSAAFVLTQIEDVPHDEAAAALGVTANHLGVLLHRARVALRGRLDAHKPIRGARP
jgi:RNA polymerase sigma-70 factor, ECF subfamily